MNIFYRLQITLTLNYYYNNYSLGMAQVGMRMPPGGNHPGGVPSSTHQLHHHTNGGAGVLAPPPTMHHMQSRPNAPTHMVQNSTGPPHLVQNSNGPPHILRRMPMHQMNHSHQTVQGIIYLVVTCIVYIESFLMRTFFTLNLLFNMFCYF